ncbi:MAG: KipI antagonist, partial [Clostridiaceae bacterium]
GYEGRQLKRGDILQLKKPSKRALEIMDNIIGNMNKSDFVYPKWFISKKFFPYYERHSTVRIIRGGEFNYFANRSKKSLFESKFIVTPQSDRMGYRLNGPSLKIKEKIEMISEAVALGTIQVPPDGNPIILLVDRQTTGGYPKIGEVISVDIPIVAQLKPGDSISFCEVSLEEAQKLYIEREQNIEDIKMTLKIKTR